MKKIKKKIIFYKHLLIEVIETLRTICFVLSFIPNIDPWDSVLIEHRNELKTFSRELMKRWDE